MSNSVNSTIDSVKYFSSAECAGKYGEKLLQEELRRLKGNIINGYISTENLYYDKQYFEIDFLVMVPGVGLTVAEVKFYAGQVYCTSAQSWKQKKNNDVETETRNASSQVLRTRALLKKLLTSKGLNKWPIKPLVIFVHPDARIFKAVGDKKPQTEILKLSMFDRWVQEQTKNESIKFTKNDFHEIYTAIKAEEKEYKQP